MIKDDLFEMFHKSDIGHPKKKMINTLIHTFVQNFNFAYWKFYSISKELHKPHLKKMQTYDDSFDFFNQSLTHLRGPYYVMIYIY